MDGTVKLPIDLVAPTTLNHCPVIKSEKHANCFTVMMEGEGQYIVATWWPDLGKTWSWGHYTPFNENDAISRNDAHNEALDDFHHASRRNAKR